MVIHFVMDSSKTDQQWHAAIRDLFPNRNNEELKRAEEVLERYFEVVLRICEDIERDPETRTRYLALTGRKSTATMTTESVKRIHH